MTKGRPDPPPPSRSTSPTCGACSSPVADATPRRSGCSPDRRATSSASRPANWTHPDSRTWSPLASASSTRADPPRPGRRWRRRSPCGGATRWPSSPRSGSPAPAIARWEELWMLATEDLVQADLAVGAHAPAIATLEGLVGRFPLRERLWGLLMVALYRDGRQGEALRAFARARAVLTEELGVDPGPELARLEADILAHAPTLEWRRQPDEDGTPTYPVVSPRPSVDRGVAAARGPDIRPRPPPRGPAPSRRRARAHGAAGGRTRDRQDASGRGARRPGDRGRRGRGLGREQRRRGGPRLLALDPGAAGGAGPGRPHGRGRGRLAARPWPRSFPNRTPRPAPLWRRLRSTPSRPGSGSRRR